MDEALRKEVVAALSRIDAIAHKTSHLLEIVEKTGSTSTTEGIHSDELLQLDVILRDLASRLYDGPVPEHVWEPPGGAALMSSAKSRSPAGGLSAYLAALNGSRAFFASFLTDCHSNVPPTETASSSLPREPETRLQKWMKWFENNRVTAVLMFAGTVIVGVATVFGALKGAFESIKPGSVKEILVKEVTPQWSMETPVPMDSPRAVADYKMLQLRLMKECGSCVRIDSHANEAPNGFNGPGSFMDLDGSKCKSGVRYLMSALTFLDSQPAALPRIGMRFWQADILPNQILRLRIEGTANFSAGPIQCLK